MLYSVFNINLYDIQHRNQYNEYVEKGQLYQQTYSKVAYKEQSFLVVLRAACQ